MIWINPTSIEMEILSFQIPFTWYGIQWIGSPEDEKPENDICFYFTYSSSYRNKNVVALIMPNEELEPVVYLNEFCPDLDAFRSTPFCNRFRDELRFDPVEQEQSGRAIAYRGTANRGNPNDVLDDLGDIHGKTFYQKPLGRTTFTAFIRK